MKPTLKQLFFTCLIAGIFFCQNTIAQPKLAKGYLGSNKLYYGAAYYPEAWPMTEVDKDIVRMKELNMNVMRIAEFAWSSMEPEEGKYNFKWLHEVIEKLNKNGIDVVICTPTATPPAWMFEKYPSIALLTENGNTKYHGGRRDCSYSSKIWREKSVQITEAMAKEFGKKPGVIGWQTDNEFNWAPDYSEETKVKWHAWLKKKYGNIDNINKLWNTALWSQTYNNIEQIPMPKNVKHDVKDGVWHHPSLLYAWYNFTNDEIRDYQLLQIAAIKKYSDLPVTHDSMPGQLVDYEKLLTDCDFASVNCYHTYTVYNMVATNYDRMRGYNKGMHWLFETAPNWSGGDRTWFNHEPLGSERAAIWMNHALGGQGSMFWLWRQHVAGQEMVHGSLISAWGKPVANFETLKKLGAELKKSSDFLMDAQVKKAEIAITYSHQATYGFDIEPSVGGLKYYQDLTKKFYVPIFDQYLLRDFVNQSYDLNAYKMLVIPMLPNMSTDFKTSLKSWVEKGGIALIGPMSAYRNEEWAGHSEGAWGDMEKWMGCTVEERVPLTSKPFDPDISIDLNWANAGMTDEHVELWTESLGNVKGKVLATYKNGLLAGKPAIAENAVGRGKVVVLGTYPGVASFGKLVKQYAAEAGVKPEATGDPGMVVVSRVGPKGSGSVVVNITDKSKTIDLPFDSYTNILTDKPVKGKNLTVPPFEVLVLKK